ncbi:MAG TPA: hypothetical protein PLH11_08655, partial [Gemmobacter sp.]|nr:hypothetical protein [Gemmobacter sp.]
MAAQNGAGANGLLIGGGLVVGVAAVAAVIWALQPDPEAAGPEVPLQATPQPALQAAPQSTAPEATTPPPVAEAIAALPTFDTVRVTPEGEALVASQLPRSSPPMVT